MSTISARICCVFIAIMASALSGGCATIVQGTTQEVSFVTTPPGATVTLNDGRVLTTPGKFELKRNTDYIATVSMPGYNQQVIPISSVLSGWLAGNFLFGGLIGGAVDLASGAAYSLTPEKVVVTLQPGMGGGGTGPVTSMSVEDRLRALERLKADGVLKENEYEAAKKKLTDELTNGKS